MDSGSMNPYEKRLYSVFKTFDVDNEEALDKNAVLDLCDALQLEDRGAALVDTLFERHTDRVTFTQFRNGLLSVLSGGEVAPASPSSPPPPPAQAPSVPTVPPPTQSDEDSSGREVAPKFVFGSKKYGRRSRPQRTSRGPGDSPRASSASRVDSEDRRARSSQRLQCRRSASAMDDREPAADDAAPTVAFDHDRRIDCDQALALCRELRMDGIDRALVDKIFEDSRDTTVGEFFDRLNARLTSTMEGGGGAPADDEASDEDDGVPGELVADAWERAGVPRPRRLLLELGFGGELVRPPDLERALDLELAALDEPPLVAAALALGRLRLRRSRRRADRAAAERDKLRADLAEANRRAQLLAHDVDDAHARMEAELGARLRRAEARHAEVVRRAAELAASERERAAAGAVRLRDELARRGDADAGLRGRLQQERERAARGEARAVAAEARAAAAEREAAWAAARLARGKGGDAAAGERGEGEEGAARELRDQLSALRREMQQLRDRNDELCGLLEGRAVEATRAGEPGEGGALAVELRPFFASDALEECDSSPASIEPRMSPRHGPVAPSPYPAALIDVAVQAQVVQGSMAVQTDGFQQTLPVLKSMAVQTDECTANQRDSVLDSTEVHAVQRESTAVQTSGAPPPPADAHALALEQLKKEFAAAENRHEDEKNKLTELIKDLEVSLEAMREEYERCEEYWASKTEQERGEHARDLRAADARLADLLARVADYERQFLPPSAASPAAPAPSTPAAPAPAPAPAPARPRAPPLPPIEERAALEAQVADLEREWAEARARYDADVRARDAELRRLRAAAAGTGAAGAGAGCACGGGAAGAREAAALVARGARAEAAARRLAARLRAADDLVKDLYLENCHLASKHRA